MNSNTLNEYEIDSPNRSAEKKKFMSVELLKFFAIFLLGMAVMAGIMAHKMPVALQDKLMALVFSIASSVLAICFTWAYRRCGGQS